MPQMKKKFLALAFAFATLAANSQVVEVVSKEPLLQGVESDMFHPTISADGEYLLFTSSNFTGLKIYDFENNVTTKISDEPRAGFKARFCGDKIVYETKTRGEFGSKSIKTKSSAISVPVAAQKVTVRTEESTIYITKNGIEKSFSPVENSAGYLWESVSPDETKVMFFAAGKGIVIMDTDGNVLSMPGNYENPAWLGNSAIVAMNATDDGHQFHSSQIVALSLDGQKFQQLTSPESMTMNPTATADGETIVFGTIDGRLYKMNVKPLK